MERYKKKIDELEATVCQLTAENDDAKAEKRQYISRSSRSLGGVPADQMVGREIQSEQTFAEWQRDHEV